MGHVFKRPDAKSYFAQFKDASGVWVKRSTGCSGKRAADLVLARFEREAFQHTCVSRASAGASNPSGAPPHETSTLDGVLGCLLDTSIANGKADGTVTMYAQKAGHLVRLLDPGANVDANTLTLAVVQQFVNQRVREGAARSTVAKELITLRAALGLARRHGVFHGTVDDVIPKLSVRYVPRERYLSREEFYALYAELEPLRALWLAVAVFTGGRASEVAKLDWSCVRWTDAPVMIRIRGTKTRESRRDIPLVPELARLLFPLRQASGPIVGMWPNCRRDLTAACKRAKIARCSPNDLRRTFASWLKQAGADSAAVARLLGHRSTKMVDLVYGHFDNATLAQTTALLERDKGETNSSVLSGHNGQLHVVQVPANSQNPVLGPGIEPGTRGFSIRAYVDPSAGYVDKYMKRDTRVGQGRDRTLRLTMPRRR